MAIEEYLRAKNPPEKLSKPTTPEFDAWLERQATAHKKWRNA